VSRAAELVEEYVAGGTLMQLATLDPDGSPAVCTVWYDAGFRPDVLRFISRPDRRHSRNLRARPRVAGTIVAGPPDRLGAAVCGTSFAGTARELPRTGIDEPLARFVARWPAAGPMLDPAALRDGTAGARLYEIRVTEWVLFDEVAFPAAPRQVVPGR
jgi:uncharacterized protein YhbP (UPF0306 family)